MTAGHILYRTVVLLLMVLQFSACSTPSSRSTPAQRSGNGTPDAMLADAMQRQEASDPERALGLVRMAAEKAPDRADIAWLYSQLCAQVAGCQPETAEARLRRLDPGNASVWLGPLTRAREAHDAAAENEILEAMSHGERFDVYWNSLVSKVAVVLSADTASQLGPQSPDLVTGNLNDAVGWISSIVVPRFTALSESCSTARMTNPAIAQRCSAISEALGRGDSYIAESFGLAIAERLAAPGSRQAMTVAEQIRRSRYQRDTAGQIITSQVEREKFSREMLKLMESLRREQDVFLAVIRWSGQPTEPTG